MANFGKLEFAVAFDPLSAFPLDGRTYFESMAAAEAAAQSAEAVGSTNTKYHYGMTLTVYENGEVSQWLILPDKTLVRITLSVTMTEDAYNTLADAGATKPGILYLIEGKAEIGGNGEGDGS